MAEKERSTVSKEFIKEHLDGKEIDLSMCSLTKVPVKELVSQGVKFGNNF